VLRKKKLIRDLVTTRIEISFASTNSEWPEYWRDGKGSSERSAERECGLTAYRRVKTAGIGNLRRETSMIAHKRKLWSLPNRSPPSRLPWGMVASSHAFLRSRSGCCRKPHFDSQIPTTAYSATVIRGPLKAPRRLHRLSIRGTLVQVDKIGSRSFA